MRKNNKLTHLLRMESKGKSVKKVGKRGRRVGVNSLLYNFP